MAEKQSNERKSTRFDGVYQRQSRTKRHMGKPDVCYSIDYRDPLTGRRVRKTIGWRSQGITMEYANAARTSLLAQSRKDQFAGIVPQEISDVPTLAQAWEMYRKDWAEARSAASLSTDKGFYANHLKYWENRKLNQITARDLEKLAADIQRKGLSAQTAKHVLGFVRRIMRRMIKWKKWSGPTPFADVEMPTVNNQRQRYLTPYEAVALLEALKVFSERAWLMSLLSLHCGLRLGEIKALRHGDLDFHAGTIFIRDPKNGRDRFAIMTEAVRQTLLETPKKGHAALLFPTRQGTILKKKDDVFDEVVTALGFNDGVEDSRQKVVFHTLRHTYASWLARGGSGQSTIAELLGHSSLQMSKRYTHLMQDAKREAATAINATFMNAEHLEPQR